MTNIAIKNGHLWLIYLFKMVIFHRFLYVYHLGWSIGFGSLFSKKSWLVVDLPEKWWSESQWEGWYPIYIYILWNIKFMFETTNQNMPGKMIIITLYILSSFLWFGNRRRNADKKKGVVRPWKVIYKWKKIIELGTDGVAITYLEPLGFSMVADKKILGISKHKQNQHENWGNLYGFHGNICGFYPHGWF